MSSMKITLDAAMRARDVSPIGPIDELPVQADPPEPTAGDSEPRPEEPTEN